MQPVRASPVEEAQVRGLLEIADPQPVSCPTELGSEAPRIQATDAGEQNETCPQRQASACLTGGLGSPLRYGRSGLKRAEPKDLSLAPAGETHRVEFMGHEIKHVSLGTGAKAHLFEASTEMGHRCLVFEAGRWLEATM